VKEIANVSNQRERCNPEHDDRDPNGNGEESVQDPKCNRCDNEETSLKGYCSRRKPPVLFQLFDFVFDVHAGGDCIQ
jgi:hypothetical protein